MSSPSRAPVPAPKPKPKPRVPQKTESEDALKDRGSSEHNGSSSPDPPISTVAPAPRPRVVTHIVPSSASTQDGSGLAPQVRPRVGTNPVTAQEKSPTHHRRSASDAKGEDEGNSLYDPPWSKRPRPPAPKKPVLSATSSLADTSHRPPVSNGETAANGPLRERDQSRSTTTAPSHLHTTSAYRRAKSSSAAETEATDLESSVVDDSELVSPKGVASPGGDASRTSVNQPSVEEDHDKDGGEGGAAVVKKPRPPRPPPYAVLKQTQPERERKGDDHDVEGGGGGGKEPVQKTGDVRPPIAGTHNMPKGEGPASPTPLSPTAKQSTMEHTKLPKSPKYPAPPPRPHPAPPPSVAKYTAEKVAADMEFFTMELLKVASSAPAGMVVKVKPIPTLPEVKEQLTGPFIERIMPMGAVDKDGRAQVGDLVAEANGHSLLCCSQQEALQWINEPGKTVRLKLGRSLAAATQLSAPPPVTEDLTVVADVGHVPMSDMSHSEDEVAAAKIEELLVEKSKLEGERDDAVGQLALFKQEMQTIIDEKEKTTAEALNKSVAAREKLSAELDVLRQQVASITSEKEGHEKVAKSVEDKNMEIASLSSQVVSLQKQLDDQRQASSEVQVHLGSTTSASEEDRETAEEKGDTTSSKELEHQLQKLQAEVAAMNAQSTEKDKRITDLKCGLSEALPKLQEAEKHITSLKEDLKMKAERIDALESEVRLRKESEAALEQAKEEAERKWEEEKGRVQALEGPAKDDQRLEELQRKVEELQKELESSRTHATEVEERCHSLEETLATLKEEESKQNERMDEDVTHLPDAQSKSPVAKPRVPRQDSKPTEDEEEEGEGGEKLPPKPTPKPRPRKKVQEQPSGTGGKTEEDGGGSKPDQDREGEVNRKTSLEDSQDWVVVEGEERNEEEEQEVALSFDDFDAVAEHTSHVSSNVLKERVRVGRNRPRKAPSKEHLRKISLGDIGDNVPTLQLKVLEDDEHEQRNSQQQLSGSVASPAPPIVLPKPTREVKRAKSADNLLGEAGSAPSTPHRVPGGVQLVPVFPGLPPLKKSLSGNSLDPDTDGGRQPVEVEQTDGTFSGKSSPNKSGLGSRPGSAKGAFGSVDSLDKLGGEVWSSSGLSFLTAPEWSPEQVSHWLQHVGLGKHSEGATEKGFNGRQLMDLDTGKIKALGMAKDDVSLLKKEVKLLKRLHEKAKKDEKKRVETEKKEAKRKKK